MRRSKNEDLIAFDPKIERTLRRIRREQNQVNTIEDQVPITPNNEARPLREYVVPLVNGIHSSIQRPIVQVNNFEIKPSMIQMLKDSVQFGGLPNDDPNMHIINFLEICDTFKYNGVSDDAIRLRLFPFSLRDKAKSWLLSLPSGSIATWDDLIQNFLAKFFSPAKTVKMRNDITSFLQLDGESLYDAWERYKDMQRKCPHHRVPKWLLVQTFYNGLTGQFRTIVDAAARGALMNKFTDKAYDLLDEMASNAYQWPTKRSTTRKIAGLHEVNTLTTLSAHVNLLTKQLSNLGVNAIKSQPITCDFCGGNHANGQCMETAQYVGDFNRNNLISNLYNPGWRNHPNFSWSNNNQ